MQAEIDEERNGTLESQQEEKVEDHAGRENIAKTDKGSPDGTAADQRRCYKQRLKTNQALKQK